MKQFTRRKFLQGLGAAPALAIAGSLAAFPRSSGQFTAGPFQQLNVVFHGVSVIEFDSGEVHAYLPVAGADYAHLAGSWMQETSLTRGGRYRLSGMITGPRPEMRDIHPTENAVFASRVTDQALSFCELILPFPDFIVPLRMVRKKRKRNFFTGSPQPIIEPDEIPQVVVFSYVHPDPTSRLQFRPLPWTPVIVDGVVNLHVWDAPAKDPTLGQAERTFVQMGKMIGSSSLRINPDYADIKPPEPDENPTVAGMSCQQEWTLIERLGHPAGCSKHRRRDSKRSPLDGLSFILY